MNKQEAETLLENLVKWKAVTSRPLKQMLAELNHEDTNVQKVFLNWFSEATETIRAARALVPEHMWIGYENLQVTGLREQDIFYAARKAVVILFKDRHESFKLQRKTNARVTSESKPNEEKS